MVTAAIVCFSIAFASSTHLIIDIASEMWTERRAARAKRTAYVPHRFVVGGGR